MQYIDIRRPCRASHVSSPKLAPFYFSIRDILHRRKFGKDKFNSHTYYTWFWCVWCWQRAYWHNEAETDGWRRYTVDFSSYAFLFIQDEHGRMSPFPAPVFHIVADNLLWSLMICDGQLWLIQLQSIIMTRNIAEIAKYCKWPQCIIFDKKILPILRSANQSQKIFHGLQRSPHQWLMWGVGRATSINGNVCRIILSWLHNHSLQVGGLHRLNYC